MLVALILVSLGTGLLAFSACSTHRITQLLGNKRKTYIYWRILLTLNVFFVLGYIGAAIIIWIQWFDFLVYLVGLVFFFGSLFVLLVTQIGLNTISDMEDEVQERTTEIHLAKREAEQANNAKSRFLATMSHEIRTPLSSIIATVDILEEMRFTVEQAEYMKILRRAGRNLLHQINDILDFSKIEAGKVELEEIPMVLNESIENVISVMGIRCEEKGIELATDIQLPEKLTVEGDPKRIEQILLNLMSNAAKFTLEGKITLQIKLREEQEDKVIIDFSVADTGVGVAPDKVDKIFESFSQADTTITRRFGGTGLGLAICKTLIEMCGGEISVSSCPNVGTTFLFYLTLVKSKEYVSTEKVLQTTDVLQQDSIQNIRVLLVEDNDDNRFLFQTFLKKLPIHLDTAENGEVAVTKTLTGKYDLIFMDIQMPIKDGFTAMKEIRQWEKNKGIPKENVVSIVALTASSTKEDVMKSYECGCDEYLSKPIRKQVLLETVSRYSTRKMKRIENILQDEKISQTKSIKGMRVLLVEDNEDNLFLFQTFLKKLPIHLDIAENGEVAVKRSFVGKYDLIFMDIQMPIKDGFTAMKEIRQWEKNEGIPKENRVSIVALTASSTKEDVMKSYECGCDEYLSKPIQRKALLETVCRYSEKRVEKE